VRVKVNLDDELARQSVAARVPMKARNGALLFVLKAGAAKPDLRIVNKLRDELSGVSELRSDAQGGALCHPAFQRPESAH
jgi:hypothetical protein